MVIAFQLQNINTYVIRQSDGPFLCGRYFLIQT